MSPPFELYGILPNRWVSWQKRHNKTQPDSKRVVPNDIYALLKRAAEIEKRAITDFVLSAAREPACRTIEATEIIRLSAKEQRRVAEAFLDPPEPTPAMKKAFRRRRELFDGE